MKLSAVLPGYSSVTHAAEVLHLAPRSVRDLIYSGRLPSVRIGRLHFLRASDVERERRRRLGLPLRQLSQTHEPRRAARAIERPPADPLLRAQRAAERLTARAEWAEHHRHLTTPLPFRTATVAAAGPTTACDQCRRPLPPGSRTVERLSDDETLEATLCLHCGRRALLGWSDQRRAEATAARSLAQGLGSQTGGEPSDRLAA
jgi:hypothetical protein